MPRCDRSQTDLGPVCEASLDDMRAGNPEHLFGGQWGQAYSFDGRYRPDPMLFT